MPIEYHSQRAVCERLVAASTTNLGPAAIHVALAEMHEQAAAAGVNERLAPFEHSHAWRQFAR
jgi:hypothetical protein